VSPKAAARTLLTSFVTLASPGLSQSQLHVSDADVEAAIDRALFDDPVVDANAVDVDVEKGVAILTGAVDNVLSKDRAVLIAQLAHGVVSVEDRLAVRSAGQSDANISADLLTAFSSDPVTDAWEIETAVREGAVVLTGTVQSGAEKALATRVAKSVAGVRSVANEIEIVPRRPRPDQEIEAEIEALIRWDERIAGIVDVAVDRGQVSLAGVVASVHEKELAIAHARQGATRVDADALDVRPFERENLEHPLAGEALDDAAVAAAVDIAMRNDPRVAEFALTATADAGTVTLEGVAPSLRAKRAAGEIARNIAGVEHLLNFIEVRPDLALTDEEILNAVRAALERDPLVAAADVTVLVDEATAKLYGVVDTRFERAHAADVVGNVNGVVDVENYLATYEAVE
jgi:hyperosmotically inducible protein